MAARTEMAGLIALFRSQRADITTAVMDDEAVQNIFDLNRFWLDKIPLQRDTEGKKYFSPFKFLESGFGIVDAGDTAVSPDSTFAMEGMVQFNTARGDSLYIRGWAHNLYWTMALAMRSVVSDNDQWAKITRGKVTLERKSYQDLADQFERMGFLPKPTRMQRGG